MSEQLILIGVGLALVCSVRFYNSVHRAYNYAESLGYWIGPFRARSYMSYVALDSISRDSLAGDKVFLRLLVLCHRYHAGALVGITIVIAGVLLDIFLTLHGRH